jgi:hypothetical protein
VAALLLFLLGQTKALGSGLTDELSWGSLALAIALIPYAQYRVWLDERELRETEEAKREKPDIRGSAYAFKQQGDATEGAYMDWKHCSAHFCFKIDITNHSNARTNVTFVHLEWPEIQPRPHFGLMMPLPELPELDRGIQRTVSLNSFAEVSGLGLREVGTLSLDGLTVQVVDGFGKFHSLSVEQGAQLVFWKEEPSRNKPVSRS